MKKPQIDRTSAVGTQLDAIKENVEALTGLRGGKILKTKGLPTPSVGVDVAAAGPAQVTLKTEHDALVTAFRDLETKYNTLADRMNTP